MFGQKPNVPIATPAAQGAPQDVLSRISQIVAILRQLGLNIPSIPNAGATTTTPLTPVNAALGQTIGNALDGKKSAIGIIGSVLISLLGAAAPNAAAVAGGAAAAAPGAGALGGVLGGLLPMLGVAVPYLQPIMLGLAAWGVLGKLDKYALTKPPQSPG
jgi:peptidoglycan L-alanyl-D-glutamate endopeptidase CwlK